MAGDPTDDGYFGEDVADRYDETSGEMFDASVVEPTVDFLAGLARRGSALEFGIGTGRIAVPLARRGVKVHGIDMSKAMVKRLRAKSGADSIEVSIGAVPFRYVWPSELDLMARLAGLVLRERWSGWKREPFTSESRKHVSVWEKGAGTGHIGT